MTWTPGDRVQWDPIGRDPYPHPTVGTVLGFAEGSGQSWAPGYALPPEPYYRVELDPPVLLPERPLDRIREHRITVLHVLGSALAPCKE